MTMTTTKTTTSRKKPTTAKKPAPKKPAEAKVTEPKIQLTASSYAHEIFAAISAERTKDKKIAILQQYNENFLKSL